MKIKVIGTGSLGNCYLLDSEAGQLLIECGVKFKDIKEGADYHLASILGCLLTHEHNDHKKSYKEVLNKGIRIYTSEGTKEALKVKYDYTVGVVKAKEQFKLGGYIIMPFAVHHDVKEPLGFLIYDTITKEKLVFATDTYYLSNTFKDVDYYLVECNYCEGKLSENVQSGEIDQGRYVRTMKSHMSVETLLEFFKKTDLKNTSEIVLIHMSDMNSKSDYIKKMIEEETKINTTVASNGDVYIFNKKY